jgi:hypothetical protein
MKKVLSYLFILIGTGLMLASTSKKLMKAIADKRRTVSGPFGLHHSGAGDLANMSFLEKEKKFFEPNSYVFKKPSDTGKNNIDLYTWGDSYLMKYPDSGLVIPDSVFAHISHYHFGRREYSSLLYTLDPYKRNILLIELSERFLRSYFADFHIYDDVKKAPLPLPVSLTAIPGQSVAELPYPHLEEIFNPSINQNLEFNLFNYNFVTPVRAVKAEINYRLFGRASGYVAVSDDENYLFLKETVRPTNLSRTFNLYYPVSKDELKNILTVTDSIYHHYKKEGFDEVYFSIIPNPATILQPVSSEGLNYNGLIDVFQSYAAKKGIPFIDVYNPFKQYPDKGRLYRAGDTHWNNNGFQVWLGLFNAELKKQSAL